VRGVSDKRIEDESASDEIGRFVRKAAFGLGSFVCDAFLAICYGAVKRHLPHTHVKFGRPHKKEAAKFRPP
jgi:hypothetical protein